MLTRGQLYSLMNKGTLGRSKKIPLQLLLEGFWVVYLEYCSTLRGVEWGLVLPDWFRRGSALRRGGDAGQGVVDDAVHFERGAPGGTWQYGQGDQRDPG